MKSCRGQFWEHSGSVECILGSDLGIIGYAFQEFGRSGSPRAPPRTPQALPRIPRTPPGYSPGLSRAPLRPHRPPQGTPGPPKCAQSDYYLGGSHAMLNPPGGGGDPPPPTDVFLRPKPPPAPTP